MRRPRHRITPTVKLFKQLGNRQRWQCNTCKCLFDSTAQVDHIQPLQFGGSNGIDNLQILCVSCHAKKTQEETDAKVRFTQYAIKGTQVEEQRLRTELAQVQDDRKDFEEALVHLQERADLTTYTYNQKLVLNNCIALNKALGEHAHRSNHERAHHIKDALTKLKQSLVLLSGNKNFSFSSKKTIIKWPTPDRGHVEMPWIYLCRPYKDLKNPDCYLGIIDQTRKKFCAKVAAYM